jgi:hypothetical protein
VRKAPWILLYDSKLEVQPVLECLRSVGVRDMGNVVKAYPDVLCLCPDEQILRVCGVLLECGIEAYSIAKMIEMCPAILGVPVDEHLLPMLDYFEVELDISLDDIGDMLRHYPGRNNTREPRALNWNHTSKHEWPQTHVFSSSNPKP